MYTISLYKKSCFEKAVYKLYKIQFTIQYKIIIIKWLVKLAKARKVCCTRRQVVPYVDDSIAKKVNSFIIRTTLFIYDIFVAAQVWLIS